MWGLDIQQGGLDFKEVGLIFRQGGIDFRQGGLDFSQVSISSRSENDKSGAKCGAGTYSYPGPRTKWSDTIISYEI